MMLRVFPRLLHNFMYFSRTVTMHSLPIRRISPRQIHRKLLRLQRPLRIINLTRYLFLNIPPIQLQLARVKLRQHHRIILHNLHFPLVHPLHINAVPREILNIDYIILQQPLLIILLLQSVHVLYRAFFPRRKLHGAVQLLRLFPHDVLNLIKSVRYFFNYRHVLVHKLLRLFLLRRHPLALRQIPPQLNLLGIAAHNHVAHKIVLLLPRFLKCLNLRVPQTVEVVPRLLPPPNQLIRRYLLHFIDLFILPRGALAEALLLQPRFHRRRQIRREPHLLRHPHFHLFRGFNNFRNLHREFFQLHPRLLERLYRQPADILQIAGFFLEFMRLGERNCFLIIFPHHRFKLAGHLPKIKILYALLPGFFDLGRAVIIRESPGDRISAHLRLDFKIVVFPLDRFDHLNLVPGDGLHPRVVEQPLHLCSFFGVDHENAGEKVLIITNQRVL